MKIISNFVFFPRQKNNVDFDSYLTIFNHAALKIPCMTSKLESCFYPSRSTRKVTRKRKKMVWPKMQKVSRSFGLPSSRILRWSRTWFKTMTSPPSKLSTMSKSRLATARGTLLWWVDLLYFFYYFCCFSDECHCGYTFSDTSYENFLILFHRLKSTTASLRLVEWSVKVFGLMFLSL